jgi:hypothetical protein
VKVVAALFIALPFALGCKQASTTSTFAVFSNDYSAASGPVLYQAFWEATSLQSPIAPGVSSDPQITVPCSPNTAYAVLAPGWDPTSSAPPTAYVVLQSKAGYGVNVGDTVEIPVDDSSFDGNCAAGSFLTQSQADFLTQFVFSSTFAGLHYDAATCRTTVVGDAGAP